MRPKPGIAMHSPPQLTPLIAFTVFLTTDKLQAPPGLPKDWQLCIRATP
jgi:hypothetical protein